MQFQQEKEEAAESSQVKITLDFTGMLSVNMPLLLMQVITCYPLPCPHFPAFCQAHPRLAKTQIQLLLCEL